MPKIVPALAVALVAVAGGTAAAPTDAAAAAGCDRACLRGALDAYMAAVFKHDPKAAPLAANLKSTSNAAPLATGDGIWRTATGYGPVQRRFVDPTNGNAVYFGHLQEGDTRDIVSVRVKVVDHKIAEAEWTIARKSDGNMFNVDGLVENMPGPDTPLPVAERTPRAQMIAAADAYFQGLQDHNGAKVPHIDGCERIENGFKVTNRLRSAFPGALTPTPAAGASPTAAEESRSGDCASGLEGFAKTIASVSPRRFTVVDEEAGVILGEVILHRPPGVATKRNLLNEYFYVKGGKISAIYAAMYYLDPTAPDGPGW